MYIKVSGVKNNFSSLQPSQYILSSHLSRNSYFCMFSYLVKLVSYTYNVSTYFTKIHSCCMVSSLSPCFFTLLSYTSLYFNFVLSVYMPSLVCMISGCVFRDTAFLFLRHLLCIIKHPPLSSFSVHFLFLPLSVTLYLHFIFSNTFIHYSVNGFFLLWH
jgi:hypothetical protein